MVEPFRRPFRNRQLREQGTRCKEGNLRRRHPPQRGLAAGRFDILRIVGSGHFAVGYSRVAEWAVFDHFRLENGLSSTGIAWSQSATRSLAKQRLL
jgi:hypothetical protein